MNDLRLDTDFVEYAILASYFLVVLGVGFAAKRYIHSSLDYMTTSRPVSELQGLVYGMPTWTSTPPAASTSGGSRPGCSASRRSAAPPS